jgi:hypothetical protein
MGWKILGVVVGVVTDIVVSLIFATLFVAALSLYLIAEGVKTHDLNARITDLTHQNVILFAEGGLGCFGSLIGGFVCGWIARSHRVLCGFIMGCGSCLSAVPFWGHDPLWFNLLGLVMTLVAAAGGAGIADALFGRKSPPLPPR